MTQRNTLKYIKNIGLVLLASAFVVPAYAKEQKQAAESIAIGSAGNYLASQFARSEGDMESATRYLKRVHAGDTGNQQVTGQLIGTMLLDGKVDEALRLSRSSSSLPETDPLSSLINTLDEVKQNKLTSVMKRLVAAEKTGTVQLWHPLLKAWVKASEQKLMAPYSIEDIVGKSENAAPLMYYHLALINSFAGFNEVAAQNYKDAIGDPKNPPSRVMDSLLQFYDANGAPDVLAPIVNGFLEEHPENGLQSDFSPIDNLHAGVAEVMYTMGNIMHVAGATHDAVIYLQLALYLQPDMGVAARTLGDAYAALQMYERSNVAYARIVASDRYYVRGRLGMVANYNKLDKTKEAFRLLDQMINAKPPVQEAIVAKADLLRMKSRYKEAVETYTLALQQIKTLSKEHWPILFARAASLERLGKWKFAEKDLLNALDLNPEQPDVLNYLGFTWLVQGRKLQEARAMLERAIKMRPNDPQIVDSMGWALYLLGQYNEAEKHIVKAVSLIPSDPVVNDHLGDVYWRQGRFDEARFQWERSLSYSPDEELAESIRKKLKEGLPSLDVAGKKPLVSAENDVGSLVH